MPKKRLEDIISQVNPSLIIYSETDSELINSLETTTETLVFEEYVYDMFYAMNPDFFEELILLPILGNYIKEKNNNGRNS